jgi:hypothetical protein
MAKKKHGFTITTKSSPIERPNEESIPGIDYEDLIITNSPLVLGQIDDHHAC